MQAIILAAGMGRRLGELTKNNTKCMVEVNGVRLIDRLLNQLTQFSLNRIILVIGYAGENLKNYLGNKRNDISLEYIENPIYNQTNNIYSLALAKDELIKDDTLLIESDLIYDTTIFKRIIEDERPNLAAVAKYESWMDGTVVLLDNDENISSFIPKSAFNFNDTDQYYKTANVYKFSKDFSKEKYIPFLEAYSKALGNNEYYESVLRVLAMLDKTGLKALPLKEDEKWYEIDDVQDLDIAETLFADKSKKLERYQHRYGGYWRFPKLLDFCYLVNPFFPPQKMKAELRANFDTLLTEYPSGMNVNSLLIGKYFNVRQQYVCVGNGAAELIKSLMKCLQGNIGVIFPTFEEYPNRKAAQEIIPFIPQNKDFSYTANDLISFFSDKELGTLLVINPDNPSGNLLSEEDIKHLIMWSKHKGIHLIIDESFVDFAHKGLNMSLINNQILSDNPHLIIIKSISKSYGVPGLRLGVIACADTALINCMKKDVAIWNINSFAEFYLQIFGKYENDYKKACSLFIAERDRFYKELQKISFLRVIPSEANYFLCEITNKYSSRELTEKLLNDFNILIKDCGTKKAFTQGNYVRIAVRDEKDNDRLITVLKYISNSKA